MNDDKEPRRPIAALFDLLDDAENRRNVHATANGAMAYIRHGKGWYRLTVEPVEDWLVAAANGPMAAATDDTHDVIDDEHLIDAGRDFHACFPVAGPDRF